MDFEQAATDADVVTAFRAITAPVSGLVGALERLRDNPLGVLPQQGGHHEDEVAFGVVMPNWPVPVPQKVGPATPRGFTLRLDPSKPVLQQLRNVVAAMEGR